MGLSACYDIAPIRKSSNEIILCIPCINAITISLISFLPKESGQISLKVASANFTAQHTIYKGWILSQWPTQTTHIDVPSFDGFGHTVTISPATSGANNGARL